MVSSSDRDIAVVVVEGEGRTSVICRVRLKDVNTTWDKDGKARDRERQR